MLMAIACSTAVMIVRLNMNREIANTIKNAPTIEMSRARKTGNSWISCWRLTTTVPTNSDAGSA